MWHNEGILHIKKNILTDDFSIYKILLKR